jgi:hypothetical protein
VTPANDTSDIAVTIGTSNGALAFYVQVCEEQPPAKPAVCKVATITLSVAECLGNDDCIGSGVCSQPGEIFSNDCVPCLDTAPPDGEDDGCAGGLFCNESNGPHACVACIDDRAPSRPVPDTGCDNQLPACDESGTPECVECLQDEDCLSGEICDEDVQVCVP